MKALNASVADVLTAHLSPWTFDGSEPCCLEFAALIKQGNPSVRDLRAAIGVNPELISAEVVDALEELSAATNRLKS